MKFVLWKCFQIQRPNLKSSLNEHLFIYGEISLVGDKKKGSYNFTKDFWGKFSHFVHSIFPNLVVS
jgi:hypothetical protein